MFILNMLNKNRETVLLDIGSSTVKVFVLKNKILKNLTAKSILFKKDFDPEKGISESSKKDLFNLVKSVKKEFPGAKIKTYATAIFRKFTPQSQKSHKDEFFQETGLFFNIIDHDLENFYLETALLGKCKLSEPVLLINIGGGSTELIIIKDRIAVERKNMDMGVGTINTKFLRINEAYSGVNIDTVKWFVSENLVELENKARIAFYTGGELTYMKLAEYKLIKNKLFKDPDHPYIVKLTDFAKKNKEIFEKIRLAKLESLMLENPDWMHGARSCSAFAEAICEKYGVETIVPSDSNLVHGAIRQEFRCVTLSGSFRKHLDYILKVKKVLESKGVKVLSPRFTEPKNPGEEFVVFGGEENSSPLELERYHLNSIEKSDALIVCNPGGYVGASAMIEIGHAQQSGKRIIFLEQPEEFLLNTLPSEVGF